MNDLIKRTIEVLKTKKNWDQICDVVDESIHIKKSHEGLLHKDLGVKQGKKLTLSQEKKALHSKDPAVRKRANFAINARKFHHEETERVEEETFHDKLKEKYPEKYGKPGTILAKAKADAKKKVADETKRRREKAAQTKSLRKTFNVAPGRRKKLKEEILLKLEKYLEKKR